MDMFPEYILPQRYFQDIIYIMIYLFFKSTQIHYTYSFYIHGLSLDRITNNSKRVIEPLGWALHDLEEIRDYFPYRTLLR